MCVYSWVWMVCVDCRTLAQDLSTVAGTTRASPPLPVSYQSQMEAPGTFTSKCDCVLVSVCVRASVKCVYACVIVCQE